MQTIEVRGAAADALVAGLGKSPPCSHAQKFFEQTIASATAGRPAESEHNSLSHQITSRRKRSLKHRAYRNMALAESR